VKIDSSTARQKRRIAFIFEIKEKIYAQRDFWFEKGKER
jgi:hypothetical protein